MKEIIYEHSNIGGILQIGALLKAKKNDVAAPVLYDNRSIAPRNQLQLQLKLHVVYDPFMNGFRYR